MRRDFGIIPNYYSIIRHAFSSRIRDHQERRGRVQLHKGLHIPLPLSPIPSYFCGLGPPSPSALSSFLTIFLAKFSVRLNSDLTS